MTLDHALRLLAMLTDTVTAQQERLDTLTAEVQRLTRELGLSATGEPRGSAPELPAAVEV